MCRDNPEATEQDICRLIPGPRGGEGARLCRCLEAGTFGAGWVRGTHTAVEPACLPNLGSRVSRPLAQSARCRLTRGRRAPRDPVTCSQRGCRPAGRAAASDGLVLAASGRVPWVSVTPAGARCALKTRRGASPRVTGPPAVRTRFCPLLLSTFPERCRDTLTVCLPVWPGGSGLGPGAPPTAHSWDRPPPLTPRPHLSFDLAAGREGGLAPSRWQEREWGGGPGLWEHTGPAAQKADPSCLFRFANGPNPLKPHLQTGVPRHLAHRRPAAAPRVGTAALGPEPRAPHVAPPHFLGFEGGPVGHGSQSLSGSHRRALPPGVDPPP